jgi:acetyltransferase-like isoleucine patch superfamily enzyme
MVNKQGYKSNKARIKSSFISKSACIFGSSKIDENSIIDSYVIIGYPVRFKTKKLSQTSSKNIILEESLNQISKGSIIGKNNHIRPYTIIYETSILEDQVETGTNVLIREKCKIDQGSIIGSNSVLDSGVLIGKNARIQSNNFIPPGIEVGDNVFLGPGVKFANDKYPVSNRLVKIKVENNVIIGIGSIILPGITIHQNAVITAGSIVTNDVNESDVMMGSPARRIMSREEYDQKKKQYEETKSE